MRKLNPTVYKKLCLQAEEAEYQGLGKLSHGILSSIGSFPEEPATYSKQELKKEIYNNIWKIASNVIGYHNLDSVDAGKLNEVIESLAETCYSQLCHSIKVDENSYSELEPLLPGEEI